MQRFVLLGCAVLVCALLVGAWSTGAGAQEKPSPVRVVPPECYTAAHDLNHDGKVNGDDMNRWKDLLFKSGEGCKLGAPAGDCPPGMDINGNGIITFDDLNIMLERYRNCVLNPGIAITLP